jgi:hypothetical protein
LDGAVQWDCRLTPERGGPVRQREFDPAVKRIDTPWWLAWACLLLVGCDDVNGRFGSIEDDYILACMKEQPRTYSMCLDMYIVETRIAGRKK